METRKTAKTYSPEVRARAVRMVSEHQGEHASQWAAICSIAAIPLALRMAKLFAVRVDQLFIDGWEPGE